MKAFRMVRLARYGPQAEYPPPKSIRAKLTRGQTEIAMMIADTTLNHAGIAAELAILPQSVRITVSRIYKRLGLTPSPLMDRRAQIARAVIDAWEAEESAA